MDGPVTSGIVKLIRNEVEPLRQRLAELEAELAKLKARRSWFGRKKEGAE